MKAEKNIPAAQDRADRDMDTFIGFDPTEGVQNNASEEVAQAHLIAQMYGVPLCLAKLLWHSSFWGGHLL